MKLTMPAAELDAAKREIFALLDSADRESLRPPTNNAARLSRREEQVMTMMLAGKRLKEIAAILDISVKTVTTHRSRLMRKLHVEDNLELYRYGIRSGLITA